MAKAITKEDYEDICASSQLVFSALNRYEVVRRKAYLDANLRYDMPQVQERSMRSQESHWVRINGLCERCNNKHLKMTINMYLMWHVQVPFQCEHKETIDSVRIEQDLSVVEGVPEYTMPLHYVPAAVDGMTVTSGGKVTVLKLDKDIRRLKRYGRKASKEIANLIDYVSVTPPPANLFPELDYDFLVNKQAAHEKSLQDAIGLISAQLQVLHDIEKNDLEGDRVDGSKEDQDQAQPGTSNQPQPQNKNGATLPAVVEEEETIGLDTPKALDTAIHGDPSVLEVSVPKEPQPLSAELAAAGVDTGGREDDVHNSGNNKEDDDGD